jgi:GNAT superfamily N-acetyltransferase
MIMADRMRTVRVREFDEFMRFLERCYGHSRNFFAHEYPHVYRPVASACACNHVIESRGRIVSHVGVYPIQAVVCGASIPVAGIGGVATVPETRGKGHMTRLIHHVIDVMREDGYLVSGLGGDRQRYNSFGWEQAGYKCCLAFSSRAMAWAHVKLMKIEEVSADEALPVVRKLHTHAMCHVKRPNLALQLRRRGFRAHRFWIAKDGYAITSGEGGNSVEVEEVVSTSGGEVAMIRAILDRVRSGNAEWTIPMCDRERIARAMPAAYWWKIRADWQYRIINLAGLLKSSRNVLEQAAAVLADFDVAIGVREHDRVDAATIGLKDGKLTIQAGRKSARYVELDPVSAVRLILGGPPSEAWKKLPPGLLKLLPVPIHVPSFDHV